MIKDYRQLFSTVRDWQLKNNRDFYDYSVEEISDEYIKNLIVPDENLEIQSTFVDKDGKIITVFRAVIEIDYRAAVNRKNNKFVYFKLMEALHDDDGNVVGYTEIGYEW